MKTNYFLKRIGAILIAMSLLVSCTKDDDSDSTVVTSLPKTDEEIEASVKLTQEIAQESSTIAKEAIDRASAGNTQINPEEIAKEIAKIDGVVSAKPNESGTAISIKQKDGIYNTLFLSTDDALKEDNSTELASTVELRTTEYTKDNIVMPNGKKALILALPSALKSNPDYNGIANVLRDCGYSVDMYLDRETGTGKYEGSFLTGYDVIYINTHGKCNMKFSEKVTGDGLATGTLYETEVVKELYKRAMQVTGVDRTSLDFGSGTMPNGKSYVCISSQFIKRTAQGKRFNRKNLIYVAACESFMNKSSDDNSLQHVVMDMGANVYMGYKESMLAPVGAKLDQWLWRYLGMGYSVDEAVSLTKLNDEVIDISGRYSLLALIGGGNTDQRSLLAYHASPEDPYYIVPPYPYNLRSRVYKGKAHFEWDVADPNAHCNLYVDGNRVDYSKLDPSFLIVEVPWLAKEHTWYVTCYREDDYDETANEYRKIYRSEDATFSMADNTNGDTKNIVGKWDIIKIEMYEVDNDKNPLTFGPLTGSSDIVVKDLFDTPSPSRVYYPDGSCNIIVYSMLDSCQYKISESAHKILYENSSHKYDFVGTTTKDYEFYSLSGDTLRTWDMADDGSTTIVDVYARRKEY